MKGSTNALMSGGAVVQGEKINLTLKTNQSTHNDLIGVSVKVSYGEYEEEYTWDGNVMTITVPAYATYTISFGEVDGYKRPNAISFDAVEGNSRSYTATYLTEKVVVNVSVDDGSPVGEPVVTIDGKDYVYNGTPVSALMPFGKEYTVSVSDSTDYTAPEPKTFVASVVTRNVEMVYISVIDLSKVDVYGNPIAQSTANCYVVKKAGKYKFPIAYGNAIKNGEVNTAAFTNNGGNKSHDFVDGKGVVITEPWIKDTGTQTGNYVASCSIAIADIETETVEATFTRSDKEYIYLNVHNVPQEGGNVIISIKSDLGIPIWNWHIWLWPHDLTPVTITNATGVEYNIMPVNLATKLDDGTVYGQGTTGYKNWFYQWGRPMPLLCPSAYNSTTNHTSYGSSSFSTSSKASNLQTGIQNPTKFYYNASSPCNWFGTKLYYNLWDASCTTTGTSDNNVVKTVYDPCPVGFKMPNGNTFTGFGLDDTVNAVGSFTYGYKFKRNSSDITGVFFPASGYRYSINGSLQDARFYGYVWSAAMSSQTRASSLYFDSDFVNPQIESDNAHGFSVRPVKDDDLQIPTHKLTINVSGDTATPSGYEVKIYSVNKSTDETTDEVTVTLGDVLAAQTTASATHEITWGATYRIVASGVDGFITPSDVEYTADMELRTVSLVYQKRAGTLNPTNGVYIQDTDGYCYTEAEWDGTYTPNGIAVITSNCRFVMALEDAYNDSCQWGGYGETIGYVTITNSESEAIGDYDGDTQTFLIVDFLKGTNDGYVDGAPAAEYCSAYTFPNGKKGYLGAAGEWQTVLDNKESVVSALNKCGGTVMSYYYWTSTQFSSNGVWCLYWSSEFLSYRNKSYTHYVRAFAAI